MPNDPNETEAEREQKEIDRAVDKKIAELEKEAAEDVTKNAEAAEPRDD